MEFYDQNHGYILYAANYGGPPGRFNLTIDSVADRAQVCISDNQA